jgi:hypothetical protein
MAVEGFSVVGRAPPGSANVSQAKAAGLVDEDIAQVEMPRAAAINRHAAPVHHFRSNLIAVPANANTAVHYDIGFRRPRGSQQRLYSALEDSPGCASPSGMQQGNGSIRHR